MTRLTGTSIRRADMVTTAIGTYQLQSRGKRERKESRLRIGVMKGPRDERQSSEGRFAGSTGLGSGPQICSLTRIAQQRAAVWHFHMPLRRSTTTHFKTSSSESCAYKDCGVEFRELAYPTSSGQLKSTTENSIKLIFFFLKKGKEKRKPIKKTVSAYAPSLASLDSL